MPQNPLRLLQTHLMQGASADHLFCGHLCWCREGESNPQGTKYRRILSPLRLPVPPSRLFVEVPDFTAILWLCPHKKAPARNSTTSLGAATFDFTRRDALAFERAAAVRANDSSSSNFTGRGCFARTTEACRDPVCGGRTR